MKRGQAFLTIVFLIGGIAVFIAITLAFMATSLIDSGYGYQSSIQADTIATAGAQDALLQIDRNISFANGAYVVTVGSSTAMVSVTQNSPSAGYATILSIATVSFYTRKVSVVVAENTSTGQMSISSWQDVQ